MKKWVTQRERERECVCVCVRERERERVFCFILMVPPFKKLSLITGAEVFIDSEDDAQFPKKTLPPFTTKKCLRLEILLLSICLKYVLNPPIKSPLGYYWSRNQIKIFIDTIKNLPIVLRKRKNKPQKRPMFKKKDKGASQEKLRGTGSVW